MPLLGGGFGAKCDFHFEGHVAALARAARRPVKLVFSRREEFFAVGHRREGMVIELETGARADGTLVARKARLVLDKGAYCGEGGFFAQMAAMHALGPVRDRERRTSSRPSTTRTTSRRSSIRAPTAPQVCWALEQHMDELAAALGMDPVELRRRTLIENGSVTATGQVLERIAMKETLEKAVELIGYGQELPEDEAIGVAVGWWPCFSAKRGAYVKLNADGTGTIITGAQENGTGAVMAMPTSSPSELGHAARGLLDPLPGHRRRALGHGLVRLADDVQQRPRRDRSRRRRARAAARRRGRAARGGAADDLELAEGTVRVKGSPDKSVTIADLAGGGTFHGKGPGELPEAPPVAGRGLRRPARPRVVPRAAADHARRARQGRPRAPASSRVLQVAAAHDCGMILNPIGADGQVYGGVVMGIGQALTEGTQLDDDGRQRNAAPARLQARDRVRRAADRHRLDRDRHAERRARRARRASASRRACRPRARSRTRSRR